MTLRVSKVRRARFALCFIAMVGLTAACGGGAPPVPTITHEPAPSGSPVASPVASGEPQPRVTPSPEPHIDAEAAERLDGKPVGAPVTPEFFMSNVDDQAGTLDIVVYVPQIFEDGGRCTATVVSAKATLAQESPAQADATGTACGLFSFALVDLGAGEATVVVRYESADHQGKSAQLKVDIP